MTHHLVTDQCDSHLYEIRTALQEFINSCSLGDSTLILDGPGIGCSRQLLWLALLGHRRLDDFESIHVFSASGYAILLYLARQCGALTYDRDTIAGWERDNRQRHVIRPYGLSFLKYLLCLMLRRPVFSGDLLEAAVTASVTESFAATMVRDLPSNLHFWTYDRSANAFMPICRHSEFANMRVGQIMRAVSSIRGVYGPFRFNGRQLSDAVSEKGLGKLFRNLRHQSKHCLFLSMARDRQAGNSRFYKMHDMKSGKARVWTDLAYFLMDWDNQEFVSDLRCGLFDLAAI